MHREKISPFGAKPFGHLYVAKQLTKKQTESDPLATAAHDAAWKKLTDRNAWGLDPQKFEVRELDDVVAEARSKKKTMMLLLKPLLSSNTANWKSRNGSTKLDVISKETMFATKLACPQSSQNREILAAI